MMVSMEYTMERMMLRGSRDLLATMRHNACNSVWVVSHLSPQIHKMTMFVDVQPGQFGYSDILRGTGMAKTHLFLL